MKSCRGLFFLERGVVLVRCTVLCSVTDYRAKQVFEVALVFPLVGFCPFISVYLCIASCISVGHSFNFCFLCL